MKRKPLILKYTFLKISLKYQFKYLKYQNKDSGWKTDS